MQDLHNRLGTGADACDVHRQTRASFSLKNAVGVGVDNTAAELQKTLSWRVVLHSKVLVKEHRGNRVMVNYIMVLLPTQSQSHISNGRPE